MISDYITSKFKEYGDSIKKTAAGLSTGLLLLSPFGTDNQALAQKKDPSSEINKSKPVAEKQFKNPDQFWIQNYDGDPEMEGVFADNQKDGTLIASYPMGEKDGETYNKLFFIPNETTKEIRAGNLDEDKQKEFSVFTDEHVLDFDWNMEDQDYDKEKYSAPNNREITDGDIVDGRPVVSVNERLDEDHPGLYQMKQNGEWEPFKQDNFDSEEFAEMVNSGAIKEFGVQMPNNPIEEFVYGDMDGDGEDEMTIVNERRPRLPRCRILSFSTDGNYGVEMTKQKGSPPLDLQISNLNPWDDKRDDLTVPGKKVLRAFDGEDWRIASFWYRSGKKITDFDNLVGKGLLPEEAKEAEGSMNWLNDYWKPKFGMIRPWLIATKNNGIRQDIDRDFRSSELSNLGPDYKDFQRYSQDADLETLNLNNRN